jgi:hypothetical protein
MAGLHFHFKRRSALPRGFDQREAHSHLVVERTRHVGGSEGPHALSRVITMNSMSRDLLDALAEVGFEDNHASAADKLTART